MNAEKASTLRLLKEGMGKTVNVLEDRGGDSFHEVRAHLPNCSEQSMIPILFLISSLSFLEAGPVLDEDGETEFAEVDGWTPADFVSHLRFEGSGLRVALDCIRGRSIFTTILLSPNGELTIQTRGRGKSATRWINYVRGRSHLAAAQVEA